MKFLIWLTAILIAIMLALIIDINLTPVTKCWDKYPTENQAIQQCEEHTK